MNQTDKPVVHLRYQQVFFVTGVIKHGNKEKAYSKAYPKAKPQSCKSAACRLYNHPEIKKLIEEGRSKALKKAFEKAMQEGADTMSDELLTVYEKRRELARIVRKQEHMTRHYKFKDRIEEKEVPVDSPFAILRAIELDTRPETARKCRLNVALSSPMNALNNRKICYLNALKALQGLCGTMAQKHARTNIPT